MSPRKAIPEDDDPVEPVEPIEPLEPIEPKPEPKPKRPSRASSKSAAKPAASPEDKPPRKAPASKAAADKRKTTSRLKPVASGKPSGKADPRKATAPMRAVNQPSRLSVMVRTVGRGIAWLAVRGWQFGQWAAPRLWVRARQLSPFAWIGVIFVCLALAGGTVRLLQPGPTPTPTPPVIAPFFAPAVQYWRPQIERWSLDYKVDANLLATVIQIESCGFPGASSSAGAQGLFQVMPMHFDSSEIMTDPETNARRGIGVLQDCLSRADNDAGLAMVCYNGGPRLISLPSTSWPEETQQYYTWGLGIYNDARRGAVTSASLDTWLASGGVYLCTRAAATLGIVTAQPGATALATSTAIPIVPTVTPAPPTITPAVKLFLTPTQ